MSEFNNGVDLGKDDMSARPEEPVYADPMPTPSFTTEQSAPASAPVPYNAGQSAPAQPGYGAARPLPSGMKFCKFCGGVIVEDAVMCTHCGRQIEELRNNAAAQQPQQIVINNSNLNSNQNTNIVGGRGGREKNKWVAVLLCFFLGLIGAHKFYEGKIGMGVLYIFTFGLFGIGALIDFIVLLLKPNPYYV